MFADDAAAPKVREGFLARVPVGRLGEPEDLAGRRLYRRMTASSQNIAVQFPGEARQMLSLKGGDLALQLHFMFEVSSSGLSLMCASPA